MLYRRLGRTNLKVSSVGFGTCQLRMVPPRQALATLRRGFELGVNLVHTAPDYEGADALVARAIAESGADVIVMPQAYDVHYNSTGYVQHFERLFEEAAETFGRNRFELFGIACIDDREAYGENVWGPGGMIEFLQQKKAEGRLGGIYCTTHGGADYVKGLIESDAFDAIMLAYNSLGFHLLSFSPPAGRTFEDMRRTKAEILPLAAERDIGVVVMKPLAGGLICDSKAFPPRVDFAPSAPPVTAGSVLRSILQDARIACVMPGTASEAEAEENALAGWDAPDGMPRAPELDARIAALRANLCSRCGQCDTTCSRDLSLSWMFRAAYVNLQPSETYETWDDVEYFKLHPEGPSACSTCDDVTCACPYGIDIPVSLMRLHDEMSTLAERGLIRGGTFSEDAPLGDEQFAAKLILCEVPERCKPGARVAGRLYVQNCGQRGWFVDDRQFAGARAQLGVYLDDYLVSQIAARHDVHQSGRGHFVFELEAPPGPGEHELAFVLLGEHLRFEREAGILLHRAPLHVGEAAALTLS
jgi:predicted aldo/keto reductase-like oxidoreductase